MRLTDFKNALARFGIPLIGGSDLITTGAVWFVSSNALPNGAGPSDSTNQGGKLPTKPFATINGLFTYLGTLANRANLNDIIVVMPGHAETVSAAAGIDADITGVRIVGLGRGSDRPTITFDTAATADMDIDAANISVENILFLAGVDALAAPIDVNAADCSLINCEFRDTSAYQTVDWIRATSQSDRLKVYNCTHRGSSADGANAFIHISGGAEDVEIVGCDSEGVCNYNISNTSTAAKRLRISHNNLVNRATSAAVNIDLVSTATGKIAYNTLRVTSAAGGVVPAVVDASDCELFENYVVTADGERGAILGTVST